MVVVLPLLVVSPLRLAFVVTVPAVRLAAVPLKFVAVMLDGVPPAPLNTIGAPAEPMLTPSAARTPVPEFDAASVAPPAPTWRICPAEPPVIGDTPIVRPASPVDRLTSVPLARICNGMTEAPPSAPNESRPPLP